MALAANKKVPAAAASPMVPGAWAYELIASFNDLLDKYNAVLVKLDADAGVTDVNYESLHGAARKIELNEIGEPNA